MRPFDDLSRLDDATADEAAFSCELLSHWSEHP
jgi:hypothetical protein